MEKTINNMLAESKLASYKIAGNGSRSTIRCKYRGRECVAYTSINIPRFLSSEVPRPEEERRRKVIAIDKLVKRKS